MWSTTGRPTNTTSSVLTKFYKSVCCFSPLQTLSLIYHLFSFPTTHFPLIALKPTDEKDSFCLLPLVFDRLYKRLFLILGENHAFAFFLSLAIGHNRRRIGSIRVRSTRSADFSMSLAIGLPASRVGVRKDGSCPSVSDRLDPPTFRTLSKDITLVMRLFSKSLAIGLPASRVGAYLRRSDSVRVYWTTVWRKFYKFFCTGSNEISMPLTRT